MTAKPRYLVEGIGSVSYPRIFLKLRTARAAAQSRANKLGSPVRIYMEFSDGTEQLQETVRPSKANPSKRKTRRRVSSALKKYVRSALKKVNPGRKVKGGRAVSLKNFTGTVIRKSNGQVLIKGKARKGR